MKAFRQLPGFFVIAATIATLSASLSFADGDWDHGHGDDWHHDHDGYSGSNGAAVGFLAGLEALVLTTMTANGEQYDAATLQVQAAEFEDTRVKGAVFEAFANQVRQKMGKKANHISQSTIDELVARELIDGSLN